MRKQAAILNVRMRRRIGKLTHFFIFIYLPDRPERDQCSIGIFGETGCFGVEDFADPTEFVVAWFVNIRAASSSFLSSVGLNKTSSAPAAIARLTVPEFRSKAVVTTTGMVAMRGSDLMRLTTSSPCIPGKPRSIKIRWG